MTTTTARYRKLHPQLWLDFVDSLKRLCRLTGYEVPSHWLSRLADAVHSGEADSFVQAAADFNAALQQLVPPSPRRRNRESRNTASEAIRKCADTASVSDLLYLQRIAEALVPAKKATTGSHARAFARKGA
jgi:hypothetical protein